MRVFIMFASIVIFACSCPFSLLSNDPQPNLPCDLGEALTYEDNYSGDLGDVIYSIYLLIENPSSLSSNSIDNGHREVLAMRSMLDDQNLTPDCYKNILENSLDHDKLALDHFIEVFNALDKSEANRAQVEYSLGLDEADVAGELFLDAICVYDISSLHKGYSTTCDMR